MNYFKLKKNNGPIFSLITPFKENEDNDFESLGNYIDFI